ncbi:contactin-2 [Pygocentrus nattereri]|uniref:contactin-2 n=1 Tax=Pygocentrus nattereri TaxID=42514 RepID=UPI00189156D0|nr:contactin-2 [Pygocentrus nattereri]
MVSLLWISAQMPCPVWLLIFSYSIRIIASQSELVFSTLPKDGVGILNSPLMLHCAVYDSRLQRVIPVKWEKDGGSLGVGVYQMANGSLFFSQLQEEDQGGYICSAKKGSKQIRTIVRVSKAYLENIFFSPQSQSAEEGQDIFFQCVSGDSSPPAYISWLKNGRAVSKGTQIQGQYGGGSQKKTSGTLHLVNTTKADQGIYVCITHNPLLNISKESTPATLTVCGVSAGLELAQSPENLTVPAETEAVLYCVVQGFPTPVVHWFKDDQMLANTSRWDLQDDGQLLVFERVLPEDEGFYHCEANNEKERLRSQPAYLLPAVMDWTFVLQPVNKTVRKGDSVTLSCRPPHSRPPAQVAWFKNNRLLRPRPHFSVEPTGDLLFHRVLETDQGYYFCRASNPYLQRAVTSRRIFLEVLAPPSVTIWPLVVTSTVGAEVLIQCQVSGHPVPSIEWTKQGRSLRTGGKATIGVRNATLYISSVRIYDEGFYTCTASNSVGQDKKTTTLRIAAKPVIVSFLESVNVSEGATIVLPCRAVGNSPMKYTWSRTMLHTPLSLSSRIYTDDNGTLHISTAHRSDAGEYYCTAENNMGQDSRKVYIIVLSADPEEDMLSAAPGIKSEEPTDSTIYNTLKFSKDTENPIHQLANTTTVDVNLKDSPTRSVNAPTHTPYIAYIAITAHDDTTMRETQQYRPTGSYSKLLLETNRQNKQPHNIPTNLITQLPDQPTLDPSLKAQPQSAYTQSSEEISQLPEKHPNSHQGHSSPSSLAQVFHSLNQTTRFTNYNLKSTTVAPVEVFQNWSQPIEQFSATKASQTNNTELVETLKKNTSKAPMRTTDNNAREKKKSQSWLPVIEKHDIPIVVGVGVSLAFIFITMAFYSLFRKNDPEAKPTGRAALRGLGGPCRHGERLAIERTYDNKAFEDDNMVAVIEQSPNTSETRAHPPGSSPSTLLMEPSYDDVHEEVQPTQDLPVIVETHPEPSEEEQLETSFEESKVTPSPQSDIQLQCMEDWRSRDFRQCQDAPSPPPPNPPASQEEGLRSSLTLQTSEPCATPVHHSINISHGSSPLLLSHCVSLGTTSVAVDVHFYPSASGGPIGSSAFGPLGPQGSSRLEHDQMAPSAHHGK